MESEENWSEFVKEHLFVGAILDGVIVLTKRGDSIYSCGNLQDLTQKYYAQFLVIFTTTSEEQDSAACQKGFILQTANDDQEIKYIIYSKNFCSVYAMSRHNRSGIIVCSLPYGVLIATYSFPCTSVKAIEIVENTCEQLRRWHIMLKCAFGLQRVQARNNGRTWIWDSETCFWDQFYSFNLPLSSLLSLSTMLSLLLSSALSLSDYVHVL